MCSYNSCISNNHRQLVFFTSLFLYLPYLHLSPTLLQLTGRVTAIILYVLCIHIMIDVPDNLVIYIVSWAIVYYSNCTVPCHKGHMHILTLRLITSTTAYILHNYWIIHMYDPYMWQDLGKGTYLTAVQVPHRLAEHGDNVVRAYQISTEKWTQYTINSLFLIAILLEWHSYQKGPFSQTVSHIMVALMLIVYTKSCILSN